MPHGHFVWTDLSTFDLPTARSDYSDLLSWSFSGDEAYDFAFLGKDEVAAIFPMPLRLVELNMPSFWMSYIQVSKLDDTVERSRSHEGVIVEVEPEAFGEDARISLVRDPSGAGFTLYEGPKLTSPSAVNGVITARYHHVHDVGTIEPFYRDLFGWEFKASRETPWLIFDIVHPDGTTIAQVEEVPESIRGNFRYWMPAFLVRSMNEIATKLGTRGGGLVAELTQTRWIVADQQGAHFIIQEANGPVGYLLGVAASVSRSKFLNGVFSNGPLTREHIVVSIARQPPLRNRCPAVRCRHQETHLVSKRCNHARCVKND